MGMTDINLWDQTAVGSQPNWENRAKVIAHFIRPNDVVLDLGAGDRKLRKYIPPSCGYIPVDCTNALPGTFVVDFNREFHLPKETFNVVVSSGFLEYISDLDSLMRNLAAECDGIYFLFTYTYDKGNASRNGYRRLNNFRDPESVLRYFSLYTNNLNEIVRLKIQSLFGCSLALNPAGVKMPSFTINEVLKKRALWQKWWRPIM